jgi:hypothetical protein
MSLNSILNLNTAKIDFNKSDILSTLNKKLSKYKFEIDYINDGELEILTSDLITFYSCNLENFTDNRFISQAYRPNNKGIDYDKKDISDFNQWDYKLTYNREFNRSEDTYLINESHHAIGCNVCKEKGKVDCSRCRGLGNISCNSCQGKGKKECGTCSGTTKKRCSSCSGKGIKETGYGANKKIETCSYCKGQGSNPCTTCSNGFVTCKTCEGKGRISCLTCYESGEVKCHQCLGYRSMDHYFVVNANFVNDKIGLLISYPFPGFDIQKAEINSFNIQNKLFDCSESRFKNDYFNEIQSHSLYNQIIDFFNFNDSQSSRLLKSRFSIFENKYIEVNFKFYGEKYTVFFDESLKQSFFLGKSPADQYEMDLLNKALTKSIDNDLKSAKNTFLKISKFDFFSISEKEIISSIDDTLSIYNAVSLLEEKKYSLVESELKLVSSIKKSERDYSLVISKLNAIYRKNTIIFFLIGIVTLFTLILDSSLYFKAITLGASLSSLLVSLFLNKIFRSIKFSRFFILALIFVQGGITKYLFSEERKILACNCYNQSVLKSGRAFDNMSYAEQNFRMKCFDEFGSEDNMKFAYECFPNAIDNQDLNNLQNNEVKNTNSKFDKEQLNDESQDLADNKIPETNFDFFKTKIIKEDGNHSEIEKWLMQIVANDNELNMDGNTSYMTKECLNFVTDIIEFNWGYPGSIEEGMLRKKWSNKFDLKYINYTHLFETGNGGWMVKVLSKIKYLGELNNGTWFQLTINGGADEHENELIRIVKVIEKDNTFYISNFLGISDN